MTVTWDRVAPAWERHAEFIDRRAAVLTDRMIELVQPVAGERVLDVACGPGGAGLAFAPLVAPGDVVLSDNSPEMLAIVRRRAADLPNVSTDLVDLDDVRLGTTFDIVISRDGLQFATDPARSMANFGAALRPGGRAALACWSAAAENPWLSVVFRVVARVTGAGPEPGAPGPFALSDPERLARTLIGAGLTDVRVTDLDVPMVAPSLDDWLDRTTDLAGPLAALLRSLPPERAATVSDEVRAAAAAYVTDDGGVRFPGRTLIAFGRKP